MSAAPKTIDQYTACSSPSANDVLLGKGNTAANTYKYSIRTLLGSGVANVVALNLLLSNSVTPSNGTPNTALKGTVSFDNTHIYIATANAVVKKVPLLAWGAAGYDSGLNVAVLDYVSASPAPSEFVGLNGNTAYRGTFSEIFTYPYGNTNLTLDSKIVWVNASNIPYVSGMDYFSSWVVKNGAITSLELTPDEFGKIRPNVEQGRYFWFTNDGVELLAPNTSADYDITIVVRNPVPETLWGVNQWNIVHGETLPVGTSNGVWLCRAVQIDELSILTVTRVSPPE